MAGGELDVAQRYAGVEGGHDEGGSKHVGVDAPEPCPLPMERTQRCAVRRSRRCTVVAAQDRALVALADGEVDGPGHPGNEGDHGRLVSLADDAQRPVSAVKTKILDVGGTGLAHPQAVETQQHRQSGVVVVIALGGEEERAELAPVQAATLIG